MGRKVGRSSELALMTAADPFHPSDRHANIGEGEVGKEYFKRYEPPSKMKNSRLFWKRRFDGEGPDKKNLDILIVYRKRDASGSSAINFPVQVLG
jgi:hypothetical protein